MFYRILAITAFVMSSSSVCSAGVVGSSLLDLENIIINKVTAGGAIIAPVTGRFTGGGGTDIRILNSATSAVNSAELSGFGSMTTETEVSVSSGFGINVAGPMNPAFAYSGSGVGSAVFTPAPDFASLSPDYTRSDSIFGNSFVDLAGDNFPFNSLALGGFAATYADFAVDTAGLQGGAISNVTNTSIVNFTATSNFKARIDFDALVALALSDTGIPNDFLTRATSSFSLTLSGTGIGPGFGLGDAQGALNQSIFLAGGPGVASYFTSGSFSSGIFDVVAGGTYTLTINQTSSVSIGQVPEPGSLAVFGVLGTVGLIVARKRRLNG